jgi:hypothetical protein
MGVVELIIVILVLLWLFGYFGRGRLLAGGTGRTLPTAGGYDLIHVLLVVALVLLIVRLIS